MAQRKQYSGEFKAKVVVQVLKGQHTRTRSRASTACIRCRWRSGRGRCWTNCRTRADPFEAVDAQVRSWFEAEPGAPEKNCSSAYRPSIQTWRRAAAR